jgi:hypothetical protein
MSDGPMAFSDHEHVGIKLHSDLKRQRLFD